MQIVLLLRLVPLLPFNMLNYLLSVTPVGIGEYMLASWLGMMVCFSFLPIYLLFTGGSCCISFLDYPKMIRTKKRLHCCIMAPGYSHILAMSLTPLLFVTICCILCIITTICFYQAFAYFVVLDFSIMNVLLSFGVSCRYFTSCFIDILTQKTLQLITR